MQAQQDYILGKGKENKEFARYLTVLVWHKMRLLLKFLKEESLMLKIDNIINFMITDSISR